MVPGCGEGLGAQLRPTGRQTWKLASPSQRSNDRKCGWNSDRNDEDPNPLRRRALFTRGAPALPREHRQKLHSTNPLERLHAEIERRTNVVGIFPNEDTITRIVGAILLEQNDEWAVARRYMTLESIAPVSDNLTVKLPAVAA